MTEPRTAEMTRPIPKVDELCGWCGISLRAVPDLPIPYTRPGSHKIEHFHYGCVSAQRTKDALGLSRPV